MTANREIDPVTGVETTGHEWDGIKELNKPLPKWWLYLFYVCILFSLGYWVLFPAWPMVSAYTTGVLNYSQRKTVADEIAQAKAAQATFGDQIRAKSLDEIRKDAQLMKFAVAGGRAAFGDNCAGCHGRGAQGAKGYPNLNDDDWIWGGSLDAIHQTILNGVRNGDEKARVSAMPRFGIDKLLSAEQINDSAEFVLQLSGQKHDAAAAARGTAIYAENCALCHGDAGKGNKELGAPNIADGIWLYGGAKADIITSIETGRGGVMPGWAARLDPETSKKLAIYVYSLGGGE